MLSERSLLTSFSSFDFGVLKPYNAFCISYLLNTSYMFGKIGDMYKLQKQAKEIKKELKHTHIEADSHGVHVTVDGEQKVVSIEIVDQGLLQNPKKLEDVLKEALNKALDKAQKVAAEQMKGVMGDLGFPGL